MESFSQTARLGQETRQNWSSSARTRGALGSPGRTQDRCRQTNRSKTNGLLADRPGVLQIASQFLNALRMAGRQILFLMRIRFQIE